MSENVKLKIGTEFKESNLEFIKQVFGFYGRNY